MLHQLLIAIAAVDVDEKDAYIARRIAGGDTAESGWAPSHSLK